MLEWGLVYILFIFCVGSGVHALYLFLTWGFKQVLRGEFGAPIFFSIFRSVPLDKFLKKLTRFLIDFQGGMDHPLYLDSPFYY